MRSTRVAAALAVVLASVALAAPAQAAPTHTRSDLRTYLAFLDANMPGAATMSHTLMHTRGDIICRSLAKGVEIPAVVRLGLAAGMSAKATVTMTSGAVHFLCPSEQHVIDEFMAS
jgi:hypothetical protein